MSVDAYKRWSEKRLLLSALATLDDAWPGEFHKRDALQVPVTIPGGVNDYLLTQMVRAEEVSMVSSGREPWNRRYRITDKGRAVLAAMRGS